eukprot:1179809-Prorocentrum_minimum.AAC.2
MQGFELLPVDAFTLRSGEEVDEYVGAVEEEELQRTPPQTVLPVVPPELLPLLVLSEALRPHHVRVVHPVQRGRALHHEGAGRARPHLEAGGSEEGVRRG